MALLDRVLEAASAAPEAAASILFIGFVVNALFGLPASAVTAAIGAVLGVPAGTAVVMAGVVTHAGLCRLLVARRPGRWARRFVDRRPNLGLLLRAIEDGGPWLVFLVRLSPALPLGATGWAFALARIPFVPYLVATGVATLPTQIVWVSLGAAGREGMKTYAEAEPTSTAQWLLIGLGLFATIASVAALSLLVRRRVEAEVARRTEKGPP